MTTHYCISCKKNREMKNAKIVRAKNGKYRYAGNCSKCGTGMSRFTKSSGSGGKFRAIKKRRRSRR